MIKNSVLRAKTYKYSLSLQYLDIEELISESTEDILMDVPGVFMLCKHIDGGHKIYWAAESEELFMTTLLELSNKLDQLPIHGTRRIYIEFIHPEFIPAMESLGFMIVSQFIDFWNDNISEYVSSVEGAAFIRPIEPKDYLQASMITKKCINLSRGFFGDEQDFIKGWDESEHSCILVAERNKSIVGVCLLNIYGFKDEKGPVLWVRELAVDPQYHNQGIGYQLAVEALCWGSCNGAKRSFLAADKENQNAIRIYNKLGYKNTDDIGQINMALVIGNEHLREIILTDSTTKFIINNLYPLYLHDLSEIWGRLPNRYGVYEENETQTLSEQNKIFDIWWEKPGVLYPYLIKENDIPVGFAFVATSPHIPPTCEFYLYEFFILRPFRGKGIAEFAAKEVFKLHSGHWELQTNPTERNVRAQHFWRKTLKGYTEDSYREEMGKSFEHEEKIVFRFNNSIS